VGAIVIAVALSALTAYFGWFRLFAFAAAVVAALDARHIGVWRYRSDIAQKPGTLFILLVLLWPFVFPWYLGLRMKIWAGTAELKDEYRFLDVSRSHATENSVFVL
jgi:hypothetical protein